jgi:hypothetical protein
LTSALILEDDTDWDVRIKDLLHDFALTSRAMVQPLAGSERSLSDSTKQENALIKDIQFYDMPATEEPGVSPYGDNWDVLWLGHCGMAFPTDDRPMPKTRIIRHNDKTVPKKNHLWSLANPFHLVEDYPHHTRATHHVQEGVCSLGYAISRRGALKLLYEVGMRDVTDAFDIMLRFFCEGVRGMRMHRCLTTQPGLFQHHSPTGPASDRSDIGEHGDEFREVAYTDMIRWSVRLNVDALVYGGKDFKDQFPA